jgi:O-antigen/teichoic acid export membrane protein
VIKQAARLVALASTYTMVQGLVRIISAASAFLIVNVLPVEQYGVYTLLLTVLTFSITFSDMGNTGSLLYFWTRARGKVQVFLSYVFAAVKLRQLFLIPLLPICAAFILNEIDKNSNSTIEAWIGIALVGFTVILGTSTATWIFALRVSGLYKSSFKVELSTEFTKLIVAGALFYLGVHSGSWMISVSAVGSVIGFLAVRQSLTQLGYGAYTPTPARLRKLQKAIFRQSLPLTPWITFFSVQGLLVAWLATTFGSISNLGELGALTRISTIVTVISGFTVQYFVPRLSLVEDLSRKVRYYLGWWLVLFTMALVATTLIWKWPQVLLFLIGEQYSHLETELIIATISSLLVAFEYYAGAFNRANGWNEHQLFRILFIVAGQVIMFFSLDFSTTIDLLYFGLGTSFLSWLSQLIFNVVGIRRLGE